MATMIFNNRKALYLTETGSRIHYIEKPIDGPHNCYTHTDIVDVRDNAIPNICFLSKMCTHMSLNEKANNALLAFLAALFVIAAMAHFSIFSIHDKV